MCFDSLTSTNIDITITISSFFVGATTSFAIMKMFFCKKGNTNLAIGKDATSKTQSEIDDNSGVIINGDNPGSIANGNGNITTTLR